jgi:hypothetical protein
MDPSHAAIHDFSRSLTPLSSVADSNEEVDKLLALHTSPTRGIPNDFADGESDLSPLTSSDEEMEDIDTTPRPVKIARTLRPRAAKAPIPVVDHSASSRATTNLSSPPPTVDQPQRASQKRKRTETPKDKTTPTMPKQKSGPFVSEVLCHQCRNRPRYAFMRCTADNENGLPCKKLFCVSCVIKRSAQSFNFSARPVILTGCPDIQKMSRSILSRKYGRVRSAGADAIAQSVAPNGT